MPISSPSVGHHLRVSNLLPAAVEMPAPVSTTMFLTPPSLTRSATAARLRSFNVEGGVLGSMGEDCPWPMLRGQKDRERRGSFWCRFFFFSRRRPILTACVGLVRTVWGGG